MRKLFTTFWIILSLCTPVFGEGLILEDSKIAIMDLGTHEGAVPFEINIFNAGKASSEYLIQRLFEVGKFNIMDRTLVESQIKASHLNTTGLIDPDTAKEIGDILGVDISTVTVKAHLIVRVMDIKTGKIIGASKGEGTSKGSFVRVKGGSVATIEIGRTKVTQDSVHNALQKAAFQTVDKLVSQFY